MISRMASTNGYKEGARKRKEKYGTPEQLSKHMAGIARLRMQRLSKSERVKIGINLVKARKQKVK